MPGVKPAWPVYQRCPAAPRFTPPGAYVYHAKNSVLELGLTSTVMPCPEVAGSYQFPDSAKSALVDDVPLVAHVWFCVRRVSGMFPDRPEPSLKL